MASFSVGTIVEILKTDNVMARFPHLVGSLGTIDLAPIHPSTWFTVKVHEDGRLVKLQTTAMKIIPKSDPRRSAMQDASAPKVKDSSNHQSAPTTRPRSNSCGNIAQFVKGTEVKIIGTENVLQRVPHLVGCVGVIKEVPVHPTTWFKVEFPDGSVHTFRPSGFRMADGSQDDEDLYPTPAPRRSTKTVSSHDGEAEAERAAAEPGIQVGSLARVKEGKYLGQVGEITRSGNGWVQLLLPEGEVSKRAHELEPVSGDRSQFNLGIAEQEERRSKSGRAIKSHLVFTPSNSEHNAPFFSVSNKSSPPKDAVAGPVKTEEKEKRKKLRITFKDQKADQKLTYGPIVDYIYEIERQAIDSPFPVVSLEKRKAKRDRFQQTVYKECEALEGRPNLSLWLKRIRTSLGEVSDDEDAEYFKRCQMRWKAAAAAARKTVAEGEENVAVNRNVNLSLSIIADASASASLLPEDGPSTRITPSPSFSKAAMVLDSFRPVDENETETGASTPMPHLVEDGQEEDGDSEDGAEEMDVDDNNNASARDRAITDVEEDKYTITIPPMALTQMSVKALGIAAAAAAAEAAKIRSDSMAETDHEEAYSPEMTGYAEGALEKASAQGREGAPSPLQLPASDYTLAKGALSRSSSTDLTKALLNPTAPPAFAEWSKLLSAPMPSATDSTNAM